MARSVARHEPRVHARARDHAGPDRRPGRGRPGRDARRRRPPRRRPGQGRPAGARRPRDRPLRPGRRVRLRPRLPAQHRPRVRAQHRALRTAPLGAGRLPELPRRPAGDGHRPPGQPRVPGSGRPGARRCRLPRHAGRHRLAHDDDQRARRARLGRRRDRGRGRHARPAALPDRAAGARRPADRRAAGGRHRDRPGADDHRVPAPPRRGRPVRRVLRPRPGRPDRRRPRHHLQHVAGVRVHGRRLPGGRQDARLHARDGTPGRADPAGRGVHQGAGPVPHRPGGPDAARSPTSRTST